MTEMLPPPSSRDFSKREVLLGGTFCVVAAAAGTLVPSRHLDLLGSRKLDAIIPETIGNWQFYSKSGLVVPPQDQLSQLLYAQLLTRVYTSPGMPPVMLLIAQSAGQTGILQIHRPDICYPAGGYQMSPRSIHEIRMPDRTVTAVNFTATSDARTEQLLFWTRIGRDMPISWAQQRLSVAKANLRGWIPDAVLMRVSTPSPDKEESIAAIDNFVRNFFASLKPELRQVFAYQQ